jgi:hypothetical protein
MDRTTSFTDSWPRQPPPEALGDRSPAAKQWAAIAALWLLAAWTQGRTPGWRGEVVTGTGAGRAEQQWPAPPPLPELARIGRLPGAGPGAPVDASVLLAHVQEGPGRPYEPTRPRAEVVAEVAGLLRERIPVAGGRGERLLTHLAGLLTGRSMDLLRVSTAGADLHLLQRDFSSTVLRYTVAPAAAVQPPPVIASDGADAALRTRLACVMTLLSEQLWVNNNNPVTFRAWIGPRDGDDPVDAAAGWWTRTRDEEPEEAPALRPVTIGELHAGLHNIVRGSLLFAGYDDEDEDEDDEDWDGSMPPVPSDHITVHLYQDLLGVLLARMTTGGVPPEILVTGYLPLDWPEDDQVPVEDDYNATVVLVGATEVAVLDLDLTC